LFDFPVERTPKDLSFTLSTNKQNRQFDGLSKHFLITCGQGQYLFLCAQMLVEGQVDQHPADQLEGEHTLF